MPDEESARTDRAAQPLGSRTAPPGDPERPAEAGPGSGVAGPCRPPADTEPDAH